MTVLDLMAFLFWFSMVCLLLAALDAVCLAVMHARDRRRIRRMMCACGSWPATTGADLELYGWLHCRDRCYPIEEAVL